MVPHARQLRRRQPADRRHSSADAQLLFWRRDARGFLAAKGSSRSPDCRYCQLHQGRATVVTRRRVQNKESPPRTGLDQIRMEPTRLETKHSKCPAEARSVTPPLDGPATVLALIERVALDP